METYSFAIPLETDKSFGLCTRDVDVQGQQATKILHSLQVRETGLRKLFSFHI